MKENISNENQNEQSCKTGVSGSIETFTYIKTVKKDMVTVVRRVNITNSNTKDVVAYKKYVNAIFPQYHSFAEMSNKKLDCIYDV